MALFFSLLLATVQATPAPPPFDAQARVTEALAKVRPIAMKRTAVDWPAIEKEARTIAASAKDSVDLLPAYHAILYRLGDNHSFLIPTADQRAGWTARYGARRFLPDTPPRKRPAPRFMKRPVSGRSVPLASGRSIRAVVIPAMDDDDRESRFADALFAAVSDGPAACGFVVDLRGNTGGNMFPMISGLSALLGDGLRLPVPSAPGQEGLYLMTERGAVVGYESVGAKPLTLARATVWQSLPTLATAPVAVLTDEATSSSGEAVAVAFRGRPQTRSFGQTTAAMASGNEEVTLSDGTIMMVTVALMADRNGGTYPAGIMPDEAVPADPDDVDATLAAASRWLGQQRACRG